MFCLDYTDDVWGSKIEVWFTGSYWGFHKTFLRREPKAAVEELFRVGVRQSELPANGHLTMICAMTKRASATVKVFLSYSQLKSLLPHVYDEFVREGVIPISFHSEKPSRWQPAASKIDEPIPTFVEIFIQVSKKTLTIEEPWVLEHFARYWNHAEHHVKHHSELVRAVMYDGDHRMPVQIGLHEIISQNAELYEFLKAYMHPELV